MEGTESCCSARALRIIPEPIAAGRGDNSLCHVDSASGRDIQLDSYEMVLALVRKLVFLSFAPSNDPGEPSHTPDRCNKQLIDLHGWGYGINPGL